jgi:hypothetical protein
MGIPAVAVVTSEFKVLADSIARMWGWPDLPMAVVPHPFTNLSPEEVVALVDRHAQDILSKVVDGVGPDLVTRRGRPAG